MVEADEIAARELASGLVVAVISSSFCILMPSLPRCSGNAGIFDNDLSMLLTFCAKLLAVLE
jgi:hypothetical protein